MIHTPFTSMTTTTRSIPEGTAVPLFSPAVCAGMRRGIVAVEAANTSSAPIYLGGVGDGSEGLAIAAGTSRLFPVTSDAPKHLHLYAQGAAAAAVTEYFA